MKVETQCRSMLPDDRAVSGAALATGGEQGLNKQAFGCSEQGMG